jgi:hypothetical protein
MIWTWIILGIILVISIFLEQINFEINPCLWIVGGIIGIVLDALGIGIISWGEAIICCIVIFILIVITKLQRVIGGGVLKGLMMCAFYLGRYVLIAFAITFILMLITAKIRARKDRLPGESIVLAMPFVAISVVFTILVMYMIGWK